MMWVVRSGKAGTHFQKYINDNRIYLPWEGYHMDLSKHKTLAGFRDLVKEEKKPESDTSIANWASQLLSFTQEMSIGDYVLIPGPRSLEYILCTVAGPYEFNENSELHHSRKVRLVSNPIPRDAFSVRTQHSLGAFRTIFKVKQEAEILSLVKHGYIRKEDHQLSGKEDLLANR